MSEEVSKVDLESKNITQKTIDELKKLIPSAFTEGKINFNALRTVLGDIVEPNREFYNFTWAGKSEAFRNIQRPSVATLKPCKDESVDFDNTENIFIEGDNLEVLKLLQKTYHNKIKMIYIDPPYNKDKDFVYPDRWSEGIKSYKEYCKFINDGGDITTTVNEASATVGRKHSNWLTMMYPRLFLARNLLTDDGAIFVSIDNDEVKNLKMICDEIYGEENFIGQFIWKNKHGGGGDSPYIVHENEFILVYAKSLDNLEHFFGKATPDYFKLFRYEDERGKYYLDRLDKKGIDSNRPNLIYPIECPDGSIKDISPAIWRLSKKEFERRKKLKNIEFKKDKNNEWQIYTKTYLYDENGIKRKVKPRAILKQEIVGFTQNGNKENIQIFEKKLFDNPKPINLISYLSDILTKDSDIVLDFFAGSGTTAHAIMALNAEDGGNRKSISVQLPEHLDKKNQKDAIKFLKSINKPINIAEITKERIRRAGKKIETEYPNKKIDTGFKVFKLDESNFKQWDKNIQNIQVFRQAIIDYSDNIIDGSSKINMLYELLLKKGYDLNSTIEVKQVNSNEIFIVNSKMYVCLDERIYKETIDEIIKLKPQHFIVLDKAFNGDDELKTNTFQTFKTLYKNRLNPFETV